MADLGVEAVGVYEYAEGYSVRIMSIDVNVPATVGPHVDIPGRIGSRLVVRAYNQGGAAVTSVDLMDLLAWVKHNRPEWWAQAS